MTQRFRLASEITTNAWDVESKRNHWSNSTVITNENLAILSDPTTSSSVLEDSLEMDTRLQAWHKTLMEREQMQAKISRRTGKKPEEMLFNLPVSVEQRDRGTIQRLLDFAGRMNPEALSKKTPDVLPELIDKDTCLTKPELTETLPKAETMGETIVEISGLPNKTKREILRGFISSNDDQYKWKNSKVLKRHIEKKAEDIKHVLEFFPKIENLEVVGEYALNTLNGKDGNLLAKEDIVSISSTTSLSEQSLVDSQAVGEVELKIIDDVIDPWANVNLGIKINDKVFIGDRKCFSRHLEYKYFFECEPFQLHQQTVLRLENIGKKFLLCEWQINDHKRRTVDCFLNRCRNFLFGDQKFTLLPGDVYETKVVFQPFRVCLQHEQWELKINPSGFSFNHGSLSVILTGKCVPSTMYNNKLKSLIDKVIDDSNDLAMRKLAMHQSELAVLKKPHEDLCPHKRVLNEREIFNAQNIGYCCERFDDIEALRSFYNSLKMPRDPAWDLRLESIKQLILRLPNPSQRELQFETFMRMQESIVCASDKRPDTIIEHSNERERSCFIYVRGCIANGIDEWEEQVEVMEHNLFGLELNRFYQEMDELDKVDSVVNELEIKPWLLNLKHENPELYVLKKLRSKKYYQDSIYIQTYSMICDIVENIVSVIESTDYI